RSARQTVQKPTDSNTVPIPRSLSYGSSSSLAYFTFPTSPLKTHRMPASFYNPLKTDSDSPNLHCIANCTDPVHPTPLYRPVVPAARISCRTPPHVGTAPFVFPIMPRWVASALCC